jgi:hypothetical protein
MRATKERETTMSNTEEHHGLVSVHACASDEEASIVISFLAENGITAQLQTDLPHSILPVSDDCEVYVHEDDAAEASRLIEEQLKRSEDAVE